MRKKARWKTQRQLARALGKACRTARLERGWSQATVGERLGISQSSYRQFEAGQNIPSCFVFARIIRLLGVELDPLIHDSDDARDCRSEEHDQVL